MEDVNNLTAGVSVLSMKSEDNILQQIAKKGLTNDTKKVQEYFDYFDKDGDGFLNKKEFNILLQHIFQKNGTPYRLTDKQQEDFLRQLDFDKDGKLNLKEFTVCWQHWLKQIFDPVTALLVVDVQNDFISGSLALSNCSGGQNGEEVIPVINSLLTSTTFDLVVYSADWHPPDHISFFENVNRRKLHKSSKVSAEEAKLLDTVVFEGPPVTEQVLWPAHCVQNSWGAEYHPDLKVTSDAVHIRKGTNPNIDSYSAFWDNKKASQTALVDTLQQRGVTDVYVCGVAYDVCVGSTAFHSIEHGFRTVLIEDAARGVSLEDIDKTRETLKTQGAVIVDSKDVHSMVSALDRRPELGYQAAVNVATAMRQKESNSHI